MKYKFLTDSIVAKIEEDGTCRMTCSITNEEYSLWLEEGNITDPADPIPQEIPQEVTMRQARLALLGINKLADVQTTIDAMESPTKEAALIEWEYSSTVKRDSQFVQLLSPVLGLSEEDLNNLFITAATL